MRFLTIIAVLVSSVSGCAPTSSTSFVRGRDPTQLATHQIEVRSLDAPFDIAYRSATQAFFSLGYSISHSDQASEILTGNRMIDVQAAKDDERQKRALMFVPYVGILAALAPTKEPTALEITVFLARSGSEKTEIRFGMKANGEPVWDQQTIDQLWVVTQREALIESGKGRPSP